MGIRYIPPFGAGGGGGIGTVSSVNASGPSGIMSWTGGPVTTSGTLSATLDAQLSGKFLASAILGGPPAAPTYRFLDTSDIEHTYPLTSLQTKRFNLVAAAIVLANGANNDIAIPDSNSLVRFTGPSAAFTVSGFSSGNNDGDVLTCHFLTTGTLTIKDQSASSATNQIVTGTGADVTSTAASVWATFIYQGGAVNRWRLEDLFDGPTSVTGYLKADGTVPMTGNLNANSNKIVSLTNGSSAQDAAAFGQLPSGILLVPAPPPDATKFLNGAATPAFALVKDSDLSLTDIATNNVSASAHGFTPKLPNSAIVYLDGTGNYTTPTGSGALNTFTPPPLLASGISTTLNGGINNAVTSLVVTSSSGFAATPFIFRIDTEAFTCTNVSGTTWTVTRAYNGTSAASHSNGATVTQSNWEWLNQGSQATATQQTSPISSIFMDSGLESASTNVRSLRRLMGAHTVVTVAYFPAWGVSASSVYGLFIREGATGKWYMFYNTFTTGSGSVNVGHGSSPTSGFTTDVTGNFTTTPIWMQFSVVGASLFFKQSTDGLNFTKMPVTIGKTSFFTTGPDEWGFAVQGASTTFNCGMNFVSMVEA